jgi:1-acyl-sn-glycerol-3-phosphate acyltransferase
VEKTLVSEDTLVADSGPEVVDAEILGARTRPLRAVRALGRLLVVALLVGTTNAFAGLLLRLTAEPERLARAIYSRLSGWLVRLLGVAAVVEGRLPEGLCVIVANHRSYIDIPLVMSMMPSIFLSKVEIAAWPLFGTAARLTSTIFVDRDDPTSRRHAFAALGEVLDRGERVVVFPEGTTSTGPGCLPFRTGAFRLAAARGLPIVPVAIAYHDRDVAWVDDTSFVAHFLECFRARRVAVSVAIGDAIRGREPGALCERAEHWILARLAATDRPC